jgi:hypothetical protein
MGHQFVINPVTLKNMEIHHLTHPKIKKISVAFSKNLKNSVISSIKKEKPLDLLWPSQKIEKPPTLLYKYQNTLFDSPKILRKPLTPL